MSINARFRPRHHRRPRSAAVTLLTIGEGQCRYPLGEPSPEMPFCGRKQTRGAFCAVHALLAYRGTARPLEDAL